MRILKQSHGAEKSKRGTDFSTLISLQKISKKTRRGILWTKFTPAGLGLSSFGSLCKKWTFQCEVCGLEKQAGNGPSRRHI